MRAVTEPTASRRALARGVAWATPAVAMGAAAPAFAASCTPTQLVSGQAPLSPPSNGATYTRTSALSAVYTWTNPFGSGNNVTATVTATPVGSGLATSKYQEPTNLHLYDLNDNGGSIAGVGATGESGPNMSVGGNPNIGYMTYTYAFSVPVTDLIFVISDIDQGERVSITPSPTFASIDTTFLQGTGTTADPWVPTTGGTELNDTTSTRGNVIVDYTTQVLSSFTITFTTNNKPSGYRHIYLSNLSFTPAICP